MIYSYSCSAGDNVREAMDPCSRLAVSRRFLRILPGTATQRRGYNISEAIFSVARCCSCLRRFRFLH